MHKARVIPAISSTSNHFHIWISESCTRDSYQRFVSSRSLLARSKLGQSSQSELYPFRNGSLDSRIRRGQLRQSKRCSSTISHSYPASTKKQKQGDEETRSDLNNFFDWSEDPIIKYGPDKDTMSSKGFPAPIASSVMTGVDSAESKAPIIKPEVYTNWFNLNVEEEKSKSAAHLIRTMPFQPKLRKLPKYKTHEQPAKDKQQVGIEEFVPLPLLPITRGLIEHEEQDLRANDIPTVYLLPHPPDTQISTGIVQSPRQTEKQEAVLEAELVSEQIVLPEMSESLKAEGLQELPKDPQISAPAHELDSVLNEDRAGMQEDSSEEPASSSWSPLFWTADVKNAYNIHSLLEQALQDESIPLHATICAVNQLNPIPDLDHTENEKLYELLLEKIFESKDIEFLSWFDNFYQRCELRDTGKNLSLSRMRNMAEKQDMDFRPHVYSSEPLMERWARVKFLYLNGSDEIGRPYRRQVYHGKKLDIPVSVARTLLREALLLLRTEQSKENDVDAAYALELWRGICTWYAEKPDKLALLFPEIVKFVESWIKDEMLNLMALRVPSAKQKAPTSKMRRRIRKLLELQHAKEEPEFMIDRHSSYTPFVIDLLKLFPADFSERILCSVILSPASGQSMSDRELSKCWSLEKLKLFLGVSQKIRGDDIYGTRPEVFFQPLESSTYLLVTLLSYKGFYTIIGQLWHASDLDIIIFYLTFRLNAFKEIRGDDPELANQIREASNNIIRRLVNKNSEIKDMDPGMAGIIYAQAILSLHFLGLRSDLLCEDLLRFLSSRKQSEKLLICFQVLVYFKKHGFQLSKESLKLAVRHLSQRDAALTVQLLPHLTTNNNYVLSMALITAAYSNPQATHRALIYTFWNRRRMDPLDPDLPIPSRNLLCQLAIRYALSENHSATRAFQRIHGIRRMMKYYHYGSDLRISKALLVTGVIRFSKHYVAGGKLAMDDAELIFRHGKLRYTAAMFMNDAGLDRYWRRLRSAAGTHAESQKLLESALSDVWQHLREWRERERERILEEENRPWESGLL